MHLAQCGSLLSMEKDRSQYMHLIQCGSSLFMEKRLEEPLHASLTV
jgi:hypothetical protein